MIERHDAKCHTKHFLKCEISNWLHNLHVFPISSVSSLLVHLHVYYLHSNLPATQYRCILMCVYVFNLFTNFNAFACVWAINRKWNTSHKFEIGLWSAVFELVEWHFTRNQFHIDWNVKINKIISPISYISQERIHL